MQGYVNRYAQEYLNLGLHLFPLYVPSKPGETDSRGREFDGKTPAVSTWGVNVPVDPAAIAKAHNLAYAIGDGVLVIDVDCKPGQPGLASWAKLIEMIPALRSFEATVRTPSGGLHHYCTIPTGVKLGKALRGFKGIDFLTKGMYCIIPGSKTVKTAKTLPGEYTFDNLMGGVEFNVTPEALVEGLSKPNTESDEQIAGPKVGTRMVNNVFGFTNLVTGETPAKIRVKLEESRHTPEQVDEWLAVVPPDLPYPQWRAVACALHDWNPGEKGFEAFFKWSQRGAKFRESGKAGCVTLWRGLDSSGDGGITIGTLIHEARLGQMSEREGQAARLIQMTEAAINLETLKTSIRKEICRESGELDDDQRARIHIAYQKRIKDLNGGVNVPIAKIRRMLKASDKQVVKGLRAKLPWTSDLLWVDKERFFVSRATGKTMEKETFLMEYTKDMPVGDNGAKANPLTMCREHGLIQTISHREYRPGEKEIFTSREMQKEGEEIPSGAEIRVLNLYNPNSIPDEADGITEEGRKLLDNFEAHVDRLLGGKEEAHILLQFLAHQVQYPGRKIKWAPVIQGPEGLGKSLFKEVLQASIGDVNVNDIKADQVKGQFNKWATGFVCGFIEELRITGSERYSAVNSLKPAITERYLMIRDLNVSQYLVRNVMNLVIFTNYKDCIPATEVGRRYWVIFSPWESIREMIADAGFKEANDYYDPLWRLVREFGSELRLYLLNYVIGTEFMNRFQAPESSAKKLMIQTEEAMSEGLQEARMLLRKGGEFFNDRIIASSEFFHGLSMEYPELDINPTTGRNRLLSRLGYSQIRMQKIAGKSRRVWAKVDMTHDEVRVAFKMQKVVKQSEDL